MRRVIAISGPTATGKTDTAIELSEIISGEIISADSVQVYKGLDIGSAKPTKSELQRAKHHLIDILEPDGYYSAAVFAENALSLIEDISSRGKVPIICGGTGFYLRSVVYNMDFAGVPPSDDFRDALSGSSTEELYERLRSVWTNERKLPEAGDRRRIVRELEIIEGGGVRRGFREQSPRLDARLYCLTYPREQLYSRINRRVDMMLDMGLVDEVKDLLESGRVTRESLSMTTIGYREIAEYIAGEKTLSEATEDIKTATRRFAKRQMTWFRHEPDVRWIDMSTTSPREAAGSIAKELEEEDFID